MGKNWTAIKYICNVEGYHNIIVVKIIFNKIYLEDVYVGVFASQLFEFGADHPAGPAPGGEEVDDDQLVSGVVEF